MDREKVVQIRGVMERKNTEELLAIWDEHDEAGWTPEAFEAIRMVLVDRKVPLTKEGRSALDTESHDSAEEPPVKTASSAPGIKPPPASEHPPGEPPRSRPAENGTPASVPVGSPVVSRYRDAYRMGTVIVGFGTVIKFGGAGLGLLVTLIGAAQGFTLGGLLLGATLGVLFWVVGVIVSAQGQMLRAQLDTAVSTSPFLSDTERAEAMGIPFRGS
jgi:hypothetical protein